MSESISFGVRVYGAFGRKVEPVIGGAVACKYDILGVLYRQRSYADR